MQTTQQLLEKFKEQQSLQRGKIVSLCKKCRKVVDFAQVGFTSRSVEGEPAIEEIGIECPNCRAWHHSYFLDQWLTDNRPQAGATRKERRAYQLRLKKFNEKTRKRLGMIKDGKTWRWADHS